jgi:hypothetical protein
LTNDVGEGGTAAGTGAGGAGQSGTRLQCTTLEPSRIAHSVCADVSLEWDVDDGGDPCLEHGGSGSNWCRKPSVSYGNEGDDHAL